MCLEDLSPYPRTCLLLRPEAAVFAGDPPGGYNTVNAMATDFPLPVSTSGVVGSSRAFCSDQAAA